jgi:omega-6 fatty acid desaturase (delta-12 desaturase)
VNQSRISPHDLKASAARFASPIRSQSALQLATTIGLFLAGCAAMYAVLPVSYWLTLALAVPTGGLLVRVFIVQHDCGHGALFRSRRANDAVGWICSLLTLTPYANWRRRHAAHHGNWNNLDRRVSASDLYSTCLTVAEFRALPRWRRLLYRCGRHPLVANLLLPPVIFLVLHRLPLDRRRSTRAERRAVHATNLAVVAIVVAAGLLLGFPEVAMVQLPVAALGAVVGVFLFTVQHRFESSLWARGSDWRFAAAALRGASYLRLPRLLQWFSGNIGFHHVHHLEPRVPNYRLEACHRALPALRAVPPLTLRGCWRALGLALWDEDRGRLVGYGAIGGRGPRA